MIKERPSGVDAEATVGPSWVADAALGIAFAAALAYAVLSPFAGEAPSVALHHLAHGAIMVVAGAVGIRIARRVPPTAGDGQDAHPGGSRPLVLAVLAEAAAIALMAFDAGSWLDRHPALHLAMHLTLMALTFAAAVWGERYRRGAGTLVTAMMAAMAAIAATGFGAG
ncbi:MAG: hypothetical protein K6V73_04105 [Firmicutes bacterium]|nr:hypothetical protein [Bacillota bacterium]